MYNTHEGIMMEYFVEMGGIMVCCKRIRQGLWTLLCVITVVSLIAAACLQFTRLPPYREAAMTIFWDEPIYARHKTLYHPSRYRIILKNETVFYFCIRKWSACSPVLCEKITVPRNRSGGPCPCCRRYS